MCKNNLISLVVALSTAALCPTLVNAQSVSDDKPAQGPPEVSRSIRQDLSRPLRDIAPLKAKEGREEKPLRYFKEVGSKDAKDTALQSFATPAVNVAITPAFNFEGVGEGLAGYNVNVAPPDTNGAVGATQYVQWVNLSFAVFDKATGNMVYGPAAGNTLWSGF